MAGRKRVIYQSEAVFVSPSPASGLHYHASGVESGNFLKEITHVQSIGHSFSVTRQDINVFGQLGAISREIIESPTVSLDMNYYVTDGSNEKFLGFDIAGNVSSVSGLLNGETDEKNVFVLIVGEGSDAVGNTDRTKHETLAIGNAYISNYTVEASVGGIPNASVTFEALNVGYEQGSSGNNIPAVNPENGNLIEGIDYIIPIASGLRPNQPAALRPGDLDFIVSTPLGAKISGAGSAHIQSFNLGIPLSREPQQRLGSKFAFSREMSFPLTVTLSVTANVADLEYGNLADLICDDVDMDLAIIMREPTCSGDGAIALRYDIKGAKLDSQNFSSTIGSNKTVDITWSAQINGPEQLDRGVFISGSYNG